VLLPVTVVGEAPAVTLNDAGGVGVGAGVVFTSNVGKKGK
jgi:hypothetical protein